MQRAEDLPVQDFSEEGAHAAAGSDAHTTGVMLVPICACYCSCSTACIQRLHGSEAA